MNVVQTAALGGEGGAVERAFDAYRSPGPPSPHPSSSSRRAMWDGNSVAFAVLIALGGILAYWFLRWLDAQVCVVSATLALSHPDPCALFLTPASSATPLLRVATTDGAITCPLLRRAARS